MPIPQTVTVTGERIFKEVMRSLRWALTQQDRCPHEERRLEHRHTAGRPRADTGERWPVQAKERDLRRSQPCLHLSLRSGAFRAVRKLIPVV